MSNELHTKAKVLLDGINTATDIEQNEVFKETLNRYLTAIDEIEV
jgi:hypothetical protein